MTGAPVPAGLTAVVPYEWTDRGVAAGADQPGARAAASTSARPARTSRRATCWSTRGHRARPAPARAARRASAGRGRALAAAPAGRGDLSTGSELREPGTPLGHDSIYDGNSFLLAAAVRRAGAIAYRVGHRPRRARARSSTRSATSWCAPTSWSPAAACRKGDYDVVKEALAPLGTVWFGGVAMQPGKPQGFGVVGEDADADLHAAGQPGVGVRLLRDVRAARAPQADGPHAVRPADASTRAAHPRDHARRAGRRQFVRGAVDVDAGGPCVTPVGGAGLAPDRRPRRGQRADRGARGRDPRRGRATRCTVLLLDRGRSDGRPSGPADPRRRVRRRPDGRRLRQGRHRPDGHGDRPGAGLAPRSSRCCAATGVPKGDALAVARLAGIMGAKQTPDADPAVPPARDLRRSPSTSRSPTTRSRSPRPCAPPTAPASRWRR